MKVCAVCFSCRFAQYQRMLGSLSQCEFSMGKTLLVYDMNLKEMENYETIYADIGENDDTMCELGESP